MKNNGKKRFLAFLLSCLLLILAVPAPTLAQTLQMEGKKGTDFSENTYISGQLQLLFDKLVYSDTPYFTVDGSTTCDNVGCALCGLAEVSARHPSLSELGVTFENTAYGSGAFARYAFALIFGVKLSAINYFGNTMSTIPLQTVGRVAAERSAGVPVAGVSGSYLLMSAENLKEILQTGTPGDLIQARSTSGGNHSMILLGVSESGVTVLHSIDYNTEEAEKNKVVISEMSYEEMVASWGQIITLFRAEADTYAETWAKGETLHLTCRYTDESGNNCSVCGKAISPLPTVSVAGAGVYMASVDTSSHESYYRSSAKKSSLTAGKWITAVGLVVNSVGKTFYLLSDGSYAPEEDFGKGTGTAPTINLTTYPSGNLPLGSSYNLRGTITISGGLSFVAGYMLEPDGSINHSVTQSTTTTYLDIYYSQINSKMKFGSLAQGDYVMMIVACSASGAMSAKLYPFSIVKQTLTTPEAPAAPTVLSKTATSVTLNTVSGCQYSKDGASWQSSPTFSGLSPATTYTFYQRLAATSTTNASPASVGLKVTTNKADANAPSAPTVASKTSTSVTLTAISGYEYGISGGNWQTSPTFTGLSPATTYYFFQRVAATATTNASQASASVAVTTSKASAATPSAPTLSTFDSTSVTLVYTAGYQYSKDGKTWQNSAYFDGLSPATTYTFYRRVAETDSASASAASTGLKVTTDKRSVATPSAPALSSKTDTTVTLKAVSGYQYSKNGTSWQSSPTFTGLSPATTYQFYQRVAETDTAYASATSTALKVTTDKKTVNAPSAPTLSSKTDVSVTLKTVSGCQYSMDGKSWQNSPTFSGLSPATTYKFYLRYAETDTAYASAASTALSVTTDKKSVSAPSAPVLEKIEGLKVTLKSVNGNEYSMDGKNWQKSAVFTVPTHGRYAFYCRLAETDTAYASPASAKLTVTVNPHAITSDGLQIDEKTDLVSGVALGTTAKDLLSKINEREYVTLKGADGRSVSGDDRLATGMLICLPEGEQYTLVVAGDVDGDGESGIFDLTAIKRQIVNGTGLSGAALLAADVDGSGTVDLFDYVAVRKYILSGEAF